MKTKKSTNKITIDKKWEIESAMNTLQRAFEIQRDSKLMADVKKMAAQKVKDFNNIALNKK